VGEARSEWRLFAEVVNRVRPDRRAHFSWPTNRDLRAEIARIVPFYAGIETLADTGDAVQWGGRHLCVEGAFPTPDGRARFSALRPPAAEVPPGSFVLSTRRGKQFNSMVHGAVDPLTGAGRDAVLIDPADATELGVAAGDRVRLRSATGSYEGTVTLARLPSRTLQVHWPEGNVLIAAGAAHREPTSKVPDYNAVVTVERV
jgi:predicted molibdopterin-dependent oxidoreductase YjgC